MILRIRVRLLMIFLIVVLASAVAIDTTFAEELDAVELTKFFDVYSQDTNPYYNSIYKVANAGIMAGFQDGIFNPYKPLTRAELAVILVRILELEKTLNEAIQLSDVDVNHWAYQFITLVLEAGIMETTDLYEFKAEENVVRKEVIYALGLYDVNDEAINEEVTRGEIAYFIDLWYKNIKKEPLEMPILIDPYDEDMRSTENFVYSLLGKYSPSTKVVTTKMLSDILVGAVKLTYDNYVYYRYQINDTANLNMLKLYSEGILQTDPMGNLFPNKELTRKEAVEIINKLANPIIPERPEYIRRNTIPILMYHEIDILPKDGPTGLYVSQQNLQNQLDALKEEGYHTITMDQLYDHWENNVPIPSKPIVLSFDDGYGSHYNFASVELSKRGMTGTFYIISSQVDVDQIRTAKRLKEMYEEGMEIGSHTVTHIDARYSSNRKIAEEYKESKEFLEKVIGSEISHFCYPIGAATSYAKEVLKELGYKTAVKTAFGKANQSQGLYDLRRIRIDYHDSVRGFLNKIR